jgi:hypothetical protein
LWGNDGKAQGEKGKNSEGEEGLENPEKRLE